MTSAPRTRAQLAAALARRGVPEAAATAVLDRFGDVGSIDDAAFSRAWVDSRHRGRGLARRALSHELRHRGVAPEVVAEAVEGLDPDQERETARELVRARLRRLSGLPPDVAARRLAGLLARKGYPPGLAYAVIREETALLASGTDEVGSDDEPVDPAGDR